MKPVVYCEENNRGIDSFYLVTNTGRYLLFQQPYRPGVHRHFEKGLLLDDALDFSKCRPNKAVFKTMDKLPLYIRYAESENGIIVLDRTLRRAQRLPLVG